MSKNIEYEGKILNINIGDAVKAIVKAGGKKIGEYMFKRYVFDIIPARKGVWVRLRTNGERSTLALKDIKNDSIEGTSEWEVEVSSFDETLKILEKCGLTPKGYQENRRTEFAIGGATVSIDHWPKLSPYLEIEAKDKSTVRLVANRLGFDSSHLVGTNTDKLYLAKGIDLDETPELRF